MSTPIWQLMIILFDMEPCSQTTRDLHLMIGLYILWAMAGENTNSVHCMSSGTPKQHELLICSLFTIHVSL